MNFYLGIAYDVIVGHELCDDWVDSDRRVFANEFLKTFHGTFPEVTLEELTHAARYLLESSATRLYRRENARECRRCIRELYQEINGSNPACYWLIQELAETIVRLAPLTGEPIEPK